MKFHNFWRYRRILLSRKFARAVRRSRRNILAARKGIPPVSGPFMAELDVTYRCNCCCEICDRWKNIRNGEMELRDYQRLAEVFDRIGVYQVSIAGGEPLLRPDIFEIIKAFSSCGLSVNLCTNGILLQNNISKILEAEPTCVTVSIDGASAQTHEQIRGAPLSYHKIEKGIHCLLAYPEGSRPILRVRMTISDQNLDEVGRFCRKWQEIADDVLLQPVHDCQDSYYTGIQKNAWLDHIPRLQEQLKGTAFCNDGYMQEFIDSLKTYGTFPKQCCYAGILMVRIDPWGNVFPCLEQHCKVGSIFEKDFEELWNSEIFNKERNRITNGRPCSCWYNNTALLGHYARLLYQTSPQNLLQNLRPHG